MSADKVFLIHVTSGTAVVWGMTGKAGGRRAEGQRGEREGGSLLRARRLGVRGEAQFREFTVGGDCIIARFSKITRRGVKSAEVRGGADNYWQLLSEQRRLSCFSLDVSVVSKFLCFNMFVSASQKASWLVQLKHTLVLPPVWFGSSWLLLLLSKTTTLRPPEKKTPCFSLSLSCV